MDIPETRNQLLNMLPADRREAMLRQAELVELPKKRLLYGIHAPITDVYFLEDGVASIVSVLRDGTAVETSTCGCEGMIGIPLFLGADQVATQAVQQVPGRGWRLSREHFLEHLEASPELRRYLGRFTQALMTLISQNSACNRRHSVEERAIRWLLMTHDQVSEDSFELTHHFFSQMLGVRRATITVTAGGLQEAGFIKYHRGVVTILNRAGLMDVCCECYAIIRNEYARQLGGQFMADPLASVELSEDDVSLVADGA
jgi:CRP-like cAMP-binding protein